VKLLFQLILLIAIAIAASSFFTPIRRAPQPIAIDLYDLELPLVREATAPQPPAQKPLPLPLPLPPAAVTRPNPPPPIPPPPTPPLVLPLSREPDLSNRDFYDRNAEAIIQIFCVTPGKFFAGSGVIVNEQGLVLTNAHIAEIVRDADAKNCQARHGNPADPFAKLEIVFIADTTAKVGDTDVPQMDFAFMKLVEPTEPFRAATVATVDAAEGTVLFTLGYPSEFLQALTASNNANLVFSSLVVAGLANIDGDARTAEAYLFRGGLALQQGSSGTAIFNPAGVVVGLMFATTKGATTADREGVALMTSYIDRVLRQSVGQGLAEFVASH